jgi:hypothetical protein
MQLQAPRCKARTRSQAEMRASVAVVRAQFSVAIFMSILVYRVITQLVQVRTESAT